MTSWCKTCGQSWLHATGHVCIVHGYRVVVVVTCDVQRVQWSVAYQSPVTCGWLPCGRRGHLWPCSGQSLTSHWRHLWFNTDVLADLWGHADWLVTGDVLIFEEHLFYITCTIMYFTSIWNCICLLMLVLLFIFVSFSPTESQESDRDGVDDVYDDENDSDTFVGMCIQCTMC